MENTQQDLGNPALIHVNQLTLPGEDRWTSAFNECSQLFMAAGDPSKTEAERDTAWDAWYAARQCLELGIY